MVLPEQAKWESDPSLVVQDKVKQGGGTVEEAGDRERNWRGDRRHAKELAGRQVTGKATGGETGDRQRNWRGGRWQAKELAESTSQASRAHVCLLYTAMSSAVIAAEVERSQDGRTHPQLTAKEDGAAAASENDVIDAPAAPADSTGLGEGVVKRRKLCSLGTGEMVHILHYRAREGMVEAFEVKVQTIVHSLYSLTSGITDIRVCHPNHGQVCFVITFLTKDDMDMFVSGPQKDADEALAELVVPGGGMIGAVAGNTAGQRTTAAFQMSGTLMPDCHTLPSLLAYLKRSVVGDAHSHHDVRSVQKEISKWFPRPAEYQPYIMWDLDNPTRYTRNLIFHNEVSAQRAAGAVVRPQGGNLEGRDRGSGWGI